MKLFTFILTLAFSTGAFAISDRALIKKCEVTGAIKLQEMAKARGCRIIANSLKAEDLDNRFFNPSKYVWYSMIETCDGQTGAKIETMVQYDSFSKKCI